ncbi:ABC transporter substrate-binding protein, partial [Ruminococcaceae bacterium OttesenSCG-928-D13]|nr:ABC transporter substrate-binding protein [Ruminococcaceae bacterium OttesenSCG-928-D13]
MKRKMLALMLCTLFVLSLAACGGGQPATGQSGSTATADPPAAGDDPATPASDTITIAMTDVSSLDPMKNWQLPSYYFYWTVYERLFRLDSETGEYEPELATSWDIAEDGMSYTFHLREGVKWTIERGIENGTGNYPGVASVDAPDDYTVVVNMTEPDSVFMDKQWTGDCCVMPYGCGDEIALKPNGTGPYKFVEWLSGDHITIERNDDYWGEPAGVSTLQFNIIPEASARLISLQSGDIDITALQSTDVKHVEADENLLIQSTTSIRVDSLGYNCQSEYFSDVRVRQAVAYAINKQAIVDGTLEGYGVTLKSPVAMGKGGYYDGMDGYDYDPEKAKELLADAGYADGFSCELS